MIQTYFRKLEEKKTKLSVFKIFNIAPKDLTFLHNLENGLTHLFLNLNQF